MSIDIRNVQHHPTVSWEQYLQMPGISFSGLKPFVGKETYGMRIGKLVHTYILKPKEYNYEEYDIVRPIASKLIDYVGFDILKHSIAEQPMTADFECDGFRFKWKGIPDMRIPKILIADFKVWKGDPSYFIQRFNTPEQLRGYMMPDEIDLGLIIPINPITRKVQVIPVTQDTRFWENTILTRGEIINQFV
jgi:hypothetical protein